MRKRAQRKGLAVLEERQDVLQPAKPSFEKKPFRLRKKSWIAISLVGIFLLLLFFNTYFNLTSEVTINPEGTGFDKFYLSGPDPYYNLRLIEETHKTGQYPFYFDPDPLLNYPLGSRGARAPLFNMMALGFSRLLSPFMSEVDAIGYSMQFIPALFGALLVFVVYFIGKELFNKRAGLIAAMLIAIIPVHLSSGHGSAYGLFDHDSFNLLLFFLTFLFLIKALKEENSTKSFLYAVLGGIPLAGLSMVWVEAHYLYAIIAVYAIVQMLIDIFTNKIEAKVFRTTSVVLITGLLISLPIITITPEGFNPTVSLYICLVVVAFGALYYLFGAKKIPWTLSVPAIISAGAIGLVFIYFSDSLTRSFSIFSPLTRLKEVIFGVGIYGNKVSMTIAEANTYQISQTVMSFGPALYWIGWAGFVFLCYQYYKNKMKKEYLFIIVLFIMDIWLAGVAGRFINDMVPVIALLSGWIIWSLVKWIDYKQMLKNIRGAGGRLHGIRKGVKLLHVFGILFIVFIVVLPNTYVAFDAVVPSKAYQKEDGNWTNYKREMFGEDYRGAFGLGIVKEKYWTHALNWLKSQDTDTQDSAKRPAFISWWDYGFYEVALGAHPTVADNFQDGIPVAANFHTSTSEEEAVVVFIVRILEGNENKNGGKLSDEVIEVLTRHLGENNSAKLAHWMDDVTSAPSYGSQIDAGKEWYDEKTSTQYTVGQQYPYNAVYHDAVDLIINNLNSDQTTWLYHDLQEVTGWSIRYYGVEGYDKQIFNIFAFLSDKSLLLVNGIADDFVELYYDGYTVDSQGKILEENRQWSAQEIINMDSKERRDKGIQITGTTQKYKDKYFETMFYKTYIGPSTGESGSKEEYSWQIPCLDMKHFYAEYISDFSNPELLYYDTGKAAVVISKYYEGAYVNGTVLFNGAPIDAEVEVVVQKNLTYNSAFTLPIDHDKDSYNATNNIFNLLAGAGARIQIRKNFGGTASFAMTNVTFEGEPGTEFAPITDDDAMRREGSNYERYLNITIQPANISGYFYNDTDDDDIYDASIDEPLSGKTVTLFEITEFLEDRVTLDTENPIVLKTNDEGYYNTSGLRPGIYRLVIENDEGFTLHFNDVALYEGDNLYDASNVKQASLEGMVYYDSNDDGNYTLGEELSDVELELTFNGETIKKTVTDSDGKYSFGSVIAGVIGSQNMNAYVITASKLPDYESEVVTYPVENQTNYENISIGLVPVAVSGHTTYDGDNVGAVTVKFEIDETATGINTAVAQSATSDDEGLYSVDLSPGSYNVTVQNKAGSTLVYSFNGKLVIAKGQSSETYAIPMDKNSSTVSGYTSFGGSNIGNIYVRFEPDKSVAGNTAETPLNPTSNETTGYSVELSPGTFNVSINTTLNVSGVDVRYTYTGKLTVSDNNPLTYNIAMSKDD